MLNGQSPPVVASCRNSGDLQTTEASGQDNAVQISEQHLVAFCSLLHRANAAIDRKRRFERRIRCLAVFCQSARVCIMSMDIAQTMLSDWLFVTSKRVRSSFQAKQGPWLFPTRKLRTGIGSSMTDLNIKGETLMNLPNSRASSATPTAGDALDSVY
jgi:hypothetical protein